MFRLPVFVILLTAVLLSLPGPAGASFAVAEYAPVLSRLYKDKQSPLASSYRISFDKSKSSAPCLTAYTLTGTAAELIRYDCTRLPADNIFSRSRSENDGSLKELAAVFNGLRHNNDDKPGIALVNDGTIDKIYADFINNASGTAFGQSVFYNRGFVKELNGDFAGSRLNNRNPERPLAAGAAVVNAAAGSISLVNVNITDNRLNNPGGTENSIWLNAGSVSRMNAVFAGNRVRGDFGSSAVLLNTGSLTSVKGIFSANSVNGEKATAGGAVLNEGHIDLIEADFVDNRLQTASADTGGAAVRIPRQGKLFTIRNANFIANTAASDSGRVLGGALSVSGTVDGLITNPVFIGNGARGRSADSAFGGAVYTEKPLTFSIDGKQNAVFSGNYTDNAGISDPNAFYIDKTSVVFSVRGNGAYIFDDNIRGSGYALFFNGSGSGIFRLNNTIYNASKIIVREGVLQLRQGPYGRGGFSAAAGLSLTVARLDMHNGYRDLASFEHLICQNCEADIDVNIENMSTDTLEIDNSLTGRVALSLHVSADDDIRGRQPLVFALSGSFAANRESFKVKKVYGSPYMFDILYKEEDDGLKKSWALVMNDIPNPDYQPTAAPSAVQKTQTNKKEQAAKKTHATSAKESAKAPKPAPVKENAKTFETVPAEEKRKAPEAAPTEGNAKTLEAAPAEEYTKAPDCHNSVGCLFFQALSTTTVIIYRIINFSHKIADKTLTSIEKALGKFINQLHKAASYFAPEPEPKEILPVGPEPAQNNVLAN